MSYLQTLTVRLSAGLERMPEPARRLHAEFIKSRQQDDGGFAGREGGSDLYYTGFSLRALAVTGELDAETAAKTLAFLRGRMTGQETIVDFFSLIYSAAVLDAAAGLDVFASADPQWRSAVSGALEGLRRDDGGYAKGPQGNASSTYHSFLVVLCQQWIESPTPDAEALVKFIMSQRCEVGGFREIRASKRAGTNPTAAAIGVLQIFDALDEETSEETIDFLLDMQTDEGGLRANTRIPIADLLSTFTGCWTLANLDAQHEIDEAAALRFVESLAQDTGGYFGAVWDQAADVEYTFYGLGCMGLLGNSG